MQNYPGSIASYDTSGQETRWAYCAANWALHPVRLVRLSVRPSVIRYSGNKKVETCNLVEA